MPTTTVRVYPGRDFDFLFGGEATVAWDGAGPTFDKVDDPVGAPDGLGGSFGVSVTTPHTAYAEWKGAAAVAGVSISAVRMYARFLARGTGGTFDVDVAGVLRPSGAGSGSSGAYFGTPVTITSETALGIVWHDELIGSWTTDPATALAFTLSTINSMAWGVRFEAPDAPGITNAGCILDQIYLEVDVVSIAADIDGVRFVCSSFLRLFRRGVPLLSMTGPLALADVDMLETWMLEHRMGPTPDGLGWGPLPWQRPPLDLYSKTYNVMQGTVSGKQINLRNFLTNWWSTFLTDIGHSLDGQGIPLLHSGGGGIAVDRNQTAYIERPGNPPDGLIMGVDTDLPPYDWRGIVVEGPSGTNSLLNSTFSQGAADAFTNWTVTESGTGAVTQTVTSFQFDVAGLRRSAALTVGASASSNAYVSSDPVAVTGPFRARVRGNNNFGAGKFGVKFQRASDNFFLQDDQVTWAAGPVTAIRFPNDAGWFDWHSILIDPGAPDDVVMHVGYFGEGSDAGYNGVVSSVELYDGAPTHIGSDLPTIASPVTRSESYVTIRNDELGRVWDPTRGSFTMGLIPFFNAADLGAGEEKVALRVALADSFFEEILFKRAGGDGPPIDRWVFRRGDEEAFLEPAGDQIPTRGELVKIAVRWVAEDGELGLPSFTFQIFVNDEQGTDALLSEVPEIGPTSSILVGSNGDDFWWDGALRHWDFCPLLLLVEELERRPS